MHAASQPAWDLELGALAIWRLGNWRFGVLEIGALASWREALLSPPSHLDSDRSPLESERFPQAVPQVSLVREVERRGDVGEEHELGGRDAGLRGVEDADFAAAWARGRVHGGHRLDEAVQLGG